MDAHLQNLLWGQAQISRALGLDHPPYSEVSDEARSSSLPANEPRSEFPCTDATCGEPTCSRCTEDALCQLEWEEQRRMYEPLYAQEGL